MSFVEWDSIYSTGIESIDQEHKQLLSMLNEVHDAMIAGNRRNVVDDVLPRLEAYTRQHFDHEEALFREYAYPRTKQHTTSHQQLRERVLILLKKNEANDQPLVQEAERLLRDWLIHHIMNEDKTAGAFLCSKGLR